MKSLQMRLQAVIDSDNPNNNTLVDVRESVYLVEIIKRCKIAESAIANIKPENANQRQVLSSYRMLRKNNT